MKKVYVVLSQADGSNYVSTEKVFFNEEAANAYKKICSRENIYRNFWVDSTEAVTEEDSIMKDDRVL